MKSSHQAAALLSLLAPALMTIILEMPAKSFTPHAHSIRSFLTGTTCNLLRVLALGVVGGRVFARPDGRFDV